VTIWTFKWEKDHIDSLFPKYTPFKCLKLLKLRVLLLKYDSTTWVKKRSYKFSHLWTEWHSNIILENKWMDGWIFCERNSSRRFNNNEIWAQPMKRLTPLSNQIKTMNLWVFLLIWCSTFSSLSNVRLRLTLDCPTISLSRMSPFHIGKLPNEQKHSQQRVPQLWPYIIIIPQHDTLA